MSTAGATPAVDTGGGPDLNQAPNPAPAGPGPSPWDDAVLAAVLMSVDPVGTGGVSLRALAGPVRDQWLAVMRDLQPEGTPQRRIPLHVSDGRLLGGLDLAATLSAGRPVAELGLLVEAHGGVVELAMAERIAAGTAARLTMAFDAGEVVLERDGLAMRTPSRFAVVALDEGVGEDEGLLNALLDRLAFHLELTYIRVHEAVACPYDADDILEARARLPSVTITEKQIEALCGLALALGIPSLRASIFACRAACASAALEERTEVADADLAVAGRLVLAPRATQLPPMEPPPDAEPPPPEPDEPDQEQNQSNEQQEPQELEDQILEATKAAIPAGLLAQLQMGKLRRSRARQTGKAGAVQNAQTRGRPAGVLCGEPRAGLRLNVVETLRAAAPWQRLRREERERFGQESTRIEVRQDDFRITRFKHKSETTTIFVVDASGSSALHRLAEAKGAVELLLADCYVRRDKVALVAFRGQAAEVLLPPTRSLVRAKRSLAGLPGGGGTPLASGIDLGMILADSVKRRGGTPVLILMTDGRANVARDGTGGRTRAGEESLAAARVVRSLEITALVIDTSPRPQQQGRDLAKEMGAVYLPLPHADANSLTQAVRATSG
ncbi:magnesium chelatase subunit D [Thiocystis violascens]|uniref:Mg-protoporphyrin IX chelatase n=1 Tax=Thiocystis violascens (strain ATCC 17096 / DSM 198 / 6111) TaxID=765911 RepID=I3Y9Z8_THIV6|nr:magnesium chelatase subunit D [Thiocystis violascens]AFL73816.1 protoporphyrin IX magnesium-chelatase [Thiocystis violascens DSM 198]